MSSSPSGANELRAQAPARRYPPRPRCPAVADALEPSSLRDRHLLVAVSGGIAAYKVCTLVSHAAQAGASVRVVMTESATRFVTPLTFQSLSGQPVLTSTWERDDRPDSQHVGLARWADLFVLAPASANTIARIAHGLCDNLVTLTAAALPRDTPAYFAPAMNADMWANPVVQANCRTLSQTLGWTAIGPESGWQACRTQGSGRMSEPETILQALADRA